MKKCKCPFCVDIYDNINNLCEHIEEEHSDELPDNFTPLRYLYYVRNNKTSGSCITCKKDTEWNETTGRYESFCENPKCREKYVELVRNRMRNKYGKTTLLNDPDHQRKMLANRKISGTYEWSDGSVKTYTGSYELDAAKFLDSFMNFDSSDIFMPSPHTYTYKYEGENHFYIPDIYIASLGLEIEIKDGGNNPNTHHKIQAVDKKKEKLKDDVMKTQKGVEYIKIVNKEYGNFMKYLSDKKNELLDLNANRGKRVSYIKEGYTPNREIIDVFSICQTLNREWSKFKYGIPVNGKIANVPSSEYYDKNYRFLSPIEFERIGGGVCWDFVEWGAEYLKRHGVEYRQYFIRTDTEDGDTHTILVCKSKGKYIYPESSFKILADDMVGVGIFDSLTDIFKYVTSWMFEVNNNKKKYKSFNYYVWEYTGHPRYGCNSIEYTEYVTRGNPIFKSIAKPEIRHNISVHENNTSNLNQKINPEIVQESYGDNKVPIFIIFTKGKTPIVSNGIKFFTKSDYTHSSISLDVNMNEIYSYNVGGFLKEDLKSFKDNEFTIYTVFVSKNSAKIITETFEKFMNAKTKYDLKILFHKMINLDIKPIATDIYDQVCSTFVNISLKTIGIDVSSGKTLPSPGDLYNSIKQQTDKFFEIFNGVVSQYNPRNIKKTLNKLKKTAVVMEVNDNIDIDKIVSENMYILENWLLENYQV